MKLKPHAIPTMHQRAASRSRPETRQREIRAIPQPAMMNTAGKENHGEATARIAIPQQVRPVIGRPIVFTVASAIATAIATSSEYCFTSLE